MIEIQFDRVKANEGEIGLIVLDRPKALNALTLNMIRQMQIHLDGWANDNAIKAVLVKSSSSKAFCAGGDIVSLYKHGQDNPKEALSFFKEEYHLNETIYEYKKPYICLLDGITMGGGVGISLHGNYPIATENFSFAMPETGIGFFPDVGGSRLLSNCKDNLGIYLGLTGKRIGTSDAIYAGLLQYAIKSEEQASFEKALCNITLSENPTDKIESLIAEFALPLNESLLEACSEELNALFKYGEVEEIVQGLEKSKTEFAIKTLKTINQKSPTSLKVTLSQIKRAIGLSMSECMVMEYKMVDSFLKGKDFYEGVRALLIDKDKSPRWSPSTIEAVKIEDVKQYF